MYSVTDLFKETVRSDAKQLEAYLYDGADYIREIDDLKYIKITSTGDFIRTVMRQAEIHYYGSHDYADSYVNLGFGVVLPLVLDLGNITLTIANPAVVTLSSHGLVTGSKIKLGTTGALPTGLVADTYYYVVYINANTFNLATSYENAIIDTPILIETTGSQSGTHSLDSYPLGQTGDTEYIDYGAFKVVEVKPSIGKNFTQLQLFDKMFESLKPYGLPYLEYPITLKVYLEAICTELGWTLGTTSFHNDDLIVEADLFSFRTFTFRQVLEQIAETAGVMMYFDIDDTLKLRGVGSAVLEAIAVEDLKELTLQSEWGILNSLVLSRDPIGDFIYDGGYYYEAFLLEDGDALLLEDGESLDTQRLIVIDEDLYQIRIENNYLMDGDREGYITDLKTELEDIQYYPFTADTIGLLYFEIGDRITVEDRDTNTYETFINEIIISFGESGFLEVFKAELPLKSNIKYNLDTGVIEDVIYKSTIGEDNIRDESITSAKVRELTADKITTGTLTAVASLGGALDGQVILDGENNNIKVVDPSSVIRVVLGRRGA